MKVPPPHGAYFVPPITTEAYFKLDTTARMYKRLYTLYWKAYKALPVTPENFKKRDHLCTRAVSYLCMYHDVILYKQQRALYSRYCFLFNVPYRLLRV